MASSHAASPASMISTPAKTMSTPASSPPPAAMEDEQSHHISATMAAEEEKMREVSRKQDEQRDRKFADEREKDIKGGKEVVDTKFKALEFLLNQSKVR